MTLFALFYAKSLQSLSINILTDYYSYSEISKTSFNKKKKKSVEWY